MAGADWAIGEYNVMELEKEGGRNQVGLGPGGQGKKLYFIQRPLVVIHTLKAFE